MEHFPSEEDARRRHESLRDLARHLVASAEDAEDAVQDTWLARLSQARGPIHNNEGWLRRVLRRQVGRQHRQRSSRAEHERRAARPEAHFPEDGALQRDIAATLKAALEDLREPYRTVLRLHYIDQLSERDVAAALERPVTTVKSQITRGLALLRRGLDGRFDGDRSFWSGLLLTSFIGLRSAVRGTAPVLAVVAGGLVALQVSVAVALDTTSSGQAPRPARPALVAELGHTSARVPTRAPDEQVALAVVAAPQEAASQLQEPRSEPERLHSTPERFAPRGSDPTGQHARRASAGRVRKGRAERVPGSPRRVKQVFADSARPLVLSAGEVRERGETPEVEQAARRRRSKPKRRGKFTKGRPQGSGRTTPVGGAGASGSFGSSGGEPPDLDAPSVPVLPRLMPDQVRSIKRTRR